MGILNNRNNMFTYFFILGNHPALSSAEIVSWFEARDIAYAVVAAQDDFIVVETEKELPRTLLIELGGTSKYGVVLDSIKEKQCDAPYLATLASDARKANKWYFGFSIYPRNEKWSARMRFVGLQVKRLLKEQGIASRLVTSKGENLSSVVVQKNKLLNGQGCEIVFLRHKDRWLVGKTRAVQPFEDLGARDYGRPGRDSARGILPPKLAHMMINLSKAHPKDAVLDPFCGSGTIVQELLFLGYTKVTGSDISEQAIQDTRRNIVWLGERFSIDSSHVQLYASDVRKLPRLLSHRVKSIITEPYLGPPLRGRESPQRIEDIREELVVLYKEAFDSFAALLEPQGRIVMVWPVFMFSHEQIFLPQEAVVPSGTFLLKNPLPSSLDNVYTLLPRRTLIYGRKGQKVWREVLLFEYAG